MMTTRTDKWFFCSSILSIFICHTLLSSVHSETKKNTTDNVRILSSGFQTLGIAVNINVSHIVSNLTHFWKSTGFCPPEPHEDSGLWLLSKDVAHNLAYISSVPGGGVEQVRIHWLLDTVKITHLQNKSPVYDFTVLDKVVSNLWDNELKPGFELMGNPSNFFTDFENKTQVYLWKEFITKLASHFIDEFGLGYVSRWNFETWNEPRQKKFTSIKMTLQGFLNYYDACSEGLKAASHLLKLGGPGGACSEMFDTKNYCWALLDHTQNGINYFTGEKGVRIDFVSFHEKGEEPDNTETLMIKEMQAITQLWLNLPTLDGTHIYNDEADPLVSWNKTKTWRADVTYAAMVAKVIAMHQNEWLSTPEQKLQYKLLSNDNGFLSFQPYVFTQRTLVARFQINTTSSQHTHFIRKPVLSVMGLLSLLGDQQIQSEIVEFDSKYTAMNTGTVSSVHLPRYDSPQDSKQISILLYNSMDTHTLTGHTLVQVNLEEFPVGSDSESNWKWVVYQLDNNMTNPYKVWMEAGQPASPDQRLLNDMRNREGPSRIYGPTEFDVNHNLSSVWRLPLPGIVLIHLCTKPDVGPDQVTKLVLYNITDNQVLIHWSDSCLNARCIKTFEVEYSPSASHPFKRINSEDIIFTLFVFTPKVPHDKNTREDDCVRGYYRVRAVDYWNRPGSYSLVSHYG